MRFGNKMRRAGSGMGAGYMRKAGGAAVASAATKTAARRANWAKRRGTPAVGVSVTGPKLLIKGTSASPKPKVKRPGSGVSAAVRPASGPGSGMGQGGGMGGKNQGMGRMERRLRGKRF